MEAVALPETENERRDFFPECIGLRIVHGDRIHMNDRVDAILALQTEFDIVNGVVRLTDGRRVGHLRMQREHASARAIVVHDHVVYAEDAVIACHHAADFVHELFLRRLSEKRIDGIDRRTDSGFYDEEGNGETAPAIDIDAGHMCEQRGKQDGRGGTAV